MKRLLLVLGGFLIVLGTLAFNQSCQSNIEYATEHGFELRHDDYRPEISNALNTTIKLYLTEKNSLRDNYYVVKFFSSKGDGMAYVGRNFTRLTPNEWQILDLEVDEVSGDKVLFFNYTPRSFGPHEMVLTIRDFFGNERRVPFKFVVPDN